ncbi:Protein of unknown function SprT domain containing protein [Aphelenchoides fujianensis]|nr:Protein of unknown function SprT domain containing protein [Aphelenchoides fujianensis]
MNGFGGHKRRADPLLGRDENQQQVVDLVGADAELLDPTPDLHTMFVHFDHQFFDGALARCVVEWSKRMKTCAGLCYFHPSTGLCTIRMSEPLLKLRPRSDFVETLLVSRFPSVFFAFAWLQHEMIHGYLFLTARNTDREGHGPEFQAHMHRINRMAGTNISIYHSFHDEVRLYKTHCKSRPPSRSSSECSGWRCDGSCRMRAPYFGWVKRTMNRAPGPTDFWFDSHQRACGGTFVKVKEPEKVEKTPKPEKTATPKPKGVVKKKEKPPVGPSIRPFLVPAPSSSKGRPVELIDLTENERPSTSSSSSSSFAGVFIGQGSSFCLPSSLDRLVAGRRLCD